MKVIKGKRIALLGAIWAIAVTVHAATDTDVSPAITRAVASGSRLPEDNWADPKLKPAQVAAFIGIRPGDKVVDFIPGRMYWSRLFSKVVGEKGHVYPFVPQLGCRPAHPGCVAAEPTSTSVGYRGRPQQTLIGDPRFNGIDTALNTENLWDFSRNMSVIWNVGGQFSIPEQLDLVWTAGHYHSLRTWDYAFDMPPFLALVFESIKPGGVFAIADYASAPGEGFTQVDTLHRVDKEAVKAEVEKAGFIFDGESTVLADASDDHTKKVKDDDIPAGVDMFLLRFKKPLNASRERRPTRDQARGWMDVTFTDADAPTDGPGTGPGAGAIWYNSDGTYQEYRSSETFAGRWFFDAAGHICLWHEYPAYVRGLLGCHPWAPRKVGDVFEEDTNRPQPARYTLRKERFYPKPRPLPPIQPTADRGRG
jgi:predicted methyltransferase